MRRFRAHVIVYEKRLGKNRPQPITHSDCPKNLILFMSITGLVFKYPTVSGIALLDARLMRSLHNDFSIYFVIALMVMMVMGIGKERVDDCAWL